MAKRNPVYDADVLDAAIEAALKRAMSQPPKTRRFNLKNYLSTHAERFAPLVAQGYTATELGSIIAEEMLARGIVVEPETIAKALRSGLNTAKKLAREPEEAPKEKKARKPRSAASPAPANEPISEPTASPEPTNETPTVPTGANPTAATSPAGERPTLTNGVVGLVPRGPRML